MSLTKRYFYGLAAVLVLSLIGIGVTQTRIEDLTEITADGIAEDDDQIFFGLDKVDAGVSRKLSLEELKKTGYQVFNVKQYGADGDGMADDTPEIQTAIDAMIAAGGGVLFFPDGTYLVTEVSGDVALTISAASKFAIIGHGATIKSSAAMPVDAGNILLYVTASSDFVIEGLTIDDDRTPSMEVFAHSLALTNCHRFTLRNVRCIDAAVDGMFIGTTDNNDLTEYCSNGQILNCTVDDSYRNAMSIIGGFNIQVIGGEYTDSDGLSPEAGIDVEADVADVGGAEVSQGIVIKSVKSSGHAGSALVVSNQNHGPVTIESCNISDCDTCGIDISGTAIVRGCDIHDFTTVSAAGAILVASSSYNEHSLIEGNNFRRVDGNKPCIYVHGTSQPGTQIIGNVAKTIYRFVTAAAPRTKVLGNNIETVETGGVIQVGAADCDVIGNTVEDYWDLAVDVTNSSGAVLVQGNTLISDNALSYAAVRAEFATGVVVVQNNYCRQTTPDSSLGILNAASGGADLRVSGNTFVGFATNPFSGAMHSAHVDATGNRTIASGTLTDTKPLTISQTWNDGADTFEGVKVKVTDTASAAGSLPFQVLGGAAGATSLASVRKDGLLQVLLETRSPVFSTRTNSGAFQLGSSDDVILVREAANHIALRNSTAAQNLSVYNTYASVSVYERGRFGWDTNVLEIGTEHVGGTARNLRLETNGNAEMEFDALSNAIVVPDNTYFLASGSTGQFIVGSSSGQITQGSHYILIDSDNNSTSQSFFIGMNAALTGSDTELFSVSENGIVAIGDRVSTDAGFQPSGTGVAVVQADGSGGISYVLQKHLVEANTATIGSPNVIAEAESNTTFTNEGATAMNGESLPPAVAGLLFPAIVQDADGMRLTAQAGDTIRLGSNVTATGGYVESTTIGDTILLKAINATEWVAERWQGSFTNGTWTTAAATDRHPIGMVTESTDQTTVTVTGKSAILFSNPNPTVVTTFTTADGVGHMLHVTASNGNTTIDNGTTIKCAGAADLVLGSNDGATFVWNGSAWIQTGYSDN